MAVVRGMAVIIVRGVTAILTVVMAAILTVVMAAILMAVTRTTATSSSKVRLGQRRLLKVQRHSRLTLPIRLIPIRE